MYPHVTQFETRAAELARELLLREELAGAHDPDASPHRRRGIWKACLGLVQGRPESGGSSSSSAPLRSARRQPKASG
jgi:hypothetical protein